MITGFNTDIEHEGVTYHVQTEDKGVDTPLILSLVYDRGTILASKRAPYDDLLKEKFDEKILAERLQKQHKTICAAVRGGRIEDLKRMTAKNSVYNRPVPPVEETVKTPRTPENKSVVSSSKPAMQVVSAKKLAEQIDQAKQTKNLQSPPPRKIEPRRPPEASEPKPEARIPKPKQELVWEVPVKIIEDDLIRGEFEIIEEEPIVEAVQILTDFAKPETPKNDRLQIEMLNETPFKGGDRRTVSIFVHRGSRESGTSAAQVMIKVLGSSFRPLIFHAQTDSSGVATVHLQLPHFRSGRAATLVRAIDSGEEAELRRVVIHG